MWKSTSWRFWKCCSFLVLKVLNQSYWLSKFGENWRKKSMERRRCKNKTRPQYWVLSSETNSTAFSHGGDDMLFVSELKTQNCGRVIFFNASYFRGRTSFFGLVHLWRPITPVQNLTRPISSTFSETSGREVSHGPNPDIFFFEQISRNERFMKKDFEHFFIAAPKKISNNFDSANIELWRLAHSSFRNLCSTFFKTPVEVSDIFKIVGPSPLRSWMIQDRGRQNWCF